MRFQSILIIVAVTIFSLACRQADDPAPRVPSFKYVKATEGGCINLRVYKGTADGREVLWVNADMAKLNAKIGTTEFDLAAMADKISISIDLWKKPALGHYCTDVVPTSRPIAKWAGKRGKVTITVSDFFDAAAKGDKRYRASVKLEGIVFEDGAGNQATLDVETFTNVEVGWSLGLK